MNNEIFSDFNKLLDEKNRDNKGVNFIRYIGVDDNKICSIVSKYVEPKKYLIYDSSQRKKIKIISRSNKKNFYYGLHPEFSEGQIIDAIYNNKMCNNDIFEKFIEKNKDKFSLHIGQECYVKELFAMILVRMASHFGVVFKIEEELLEEFKTLISCYNNLFIENITYKIDANLNQVKLLGGLTDEMVKILDESKFNVYWNKDEKEFSILKESSNDRYIKLQSIRNIYNEEYKKFKIIKLIEDYLYYSGVLPRTKHIEIIDNYYNPNVQTIKFIVERTTYATVDAMDNVFIKNHPLLKKYENVINKFLEKEFEVQEILFNKKTFESRDNMLNEVNNYLEKSYNTNTIAVSGNIITSDNKLILARRNHKVIDKGTLYCSVNGQSEFFDSNVEFYKNSIYDDYPTLRMNSNTRNDFNDELNREVSAELSINSLKKEWKYYGISILGIRNKNCKEIYERRMHFNILAENCIGESFNTIYDKQKQSVENFESEDIYGVSFGIYRNILSKLKNKVANMLNAIHEKESFILSFIVFLLAINNFISQYISRGGMNLFKGVSVNSFGDLLNILNKFVSFILPLITILILLNNIYKNIKYIRYNMKIEFEMTSYSSEKLNNQLVKIEKKFCYLHPISSLMIMLYLYDSVSEK